MGLKRSIQRSASLADLAAQSGTFARQLVWTAAKTSAYSAQVGDAVPADTTGGTFAVTLNAGSPPGVIRVKWKAGVYPPTIVTAGGRALDPTWVGFGAVGDSVDFSDDGTTWNVA